MVLSSEKYGERVTYSGLLVVCALAARLRGMNVEAIVSRLREHLAQGGQCRWMDLEIALKTDQRDLVALMLESGAKIDLISMLERLSGFREPVSALADVADYLEKSGKKYEDICQPLEIIEPNSSAVVVNSFEQLMAADNGFTRVITLMVNGVNKVEKDVREGYRIAPHNSEQLLRELIRFAGALHSGFVGPTLLVRAAEYAYYELAKALLEYGVNPNEYQPDGIRRDWRDWAEKLPVHMAVHYPELLRLLVAHGADVNLPMRGKEENLLHILCTDKEVDPEMFYTFAECGGDFARKFDGKTAASLVKERGEEHYKAFMSAKTGIVVAKSLDVKADGVVAKRSAAPKLGPL